MRFFNFREGRGDFFLFSGVRSFAAFLLQMLKNTRKKESENAKIPSPGAEGRGVESPQACCL